MVIFLVGGFIFKNCLIPNNGHFFHQSMTLGLRHLSRAASSVVRGFPLGSMRLFTDVLLV